MRSETISAPAHQKSVKVFDKIVALHYLRKHPPQAVRVPVAIMLIKVPIVNSFQQRHKLPQIGGTG